MHIKDFKKYFSESFDLKNENLIGDLIENGVLIEKDSNKEIPIVNYIIRITSKEGYVSNFGLQWNTFKSTQLDSFSGFPLTANRFWTNTKWKPDDLKGKTVLEVGYGAGRFTEIMLNSGANVVSVDMSNAVDVNYKNNSENTASIGLSFIPNPKSEFDLSFKKINNSSNQFELSFNKILKDNWTYNLGFGVYEKSNSKLNTDLSFSTKINF